jgi:Domain of unknown function (DUF5664)
MGKENFITKDSGKRVTFETGMQRDVNENKPRFDLITPAGLPFEERMLTRWARLMDRGASKYGERNWEKASTEEEKKRFMDSAYRHFMQWAAGETDEDHAAAVFFNISGAEMVDSKLKNNGGTCERAVAEFKKNYPNNNTQFSITPTAIEVVERPKLGRPEKKLTAKELGKHLGVHAHTIHHYFKNGLIPGERLTPRKTLFKLSEVKETLVYQAKMSRIRVNIPRV